MNIIVKQDKEVKYIDPSPGGEGQEGAHFNLDRVLEGDMDDIIEALIARDRAERLANL
ncbi:MAG: hypothetical protein NTV86_02700 [Planctomycetota bacterium]|nr:hypothetical protein [Planctomycetota bacterium]